MTPEEPLPVATSVETRSSFRWVIWAAVLIAFVVGVIFIWRSTHQPPADGAMGPGGPGGGGRRSPRAGAMPVSVAAAQKTTFDVYLNALGTVTPVNTVTVHSRVDGQLMRIAFKEGQLVKAGTLLAELDPRPFQVLLTQANGQLARDQALLKNAEVDLERYRTLLAEDSAPKQQLDTQQALVRQYHAAIEIDQGQVDSAKLQLVFARITAPIDGRIGLKQVDEGNIVHSSDANGVVVITQLNPITVVFSIPEDQLSPIAQRATHGEQLPVQAWDRAATTHLADGTLTTFDNQVDPTTGTVKLKAQFDNEASKLFPNQFVNVKLRVSQLQDAIVIPTAAIQRGQQGTFVYVVNGENAVSVRPVTLGPTQGDKVVLTRGLQAGESIVTDGGDKLRDGAKVEPISTEQRTPPPADAANAPHKQWNQDGSKHHRRSDSSTGNTTPAAP
jgi:multidrug efflux system membrane fusion protein